jgi:hypothetical protein
VLQRELNSFLKKQNIYTMKAIKINRIILMLMLLLASVALQAQEICEDDEISVEDEVGEEIVDIKPSEISGVSEIEEGEMMSMEIEETTMEASDVTEFLIESEEFGPEGLVVAASVLAMTATFDYLYGTHYTEEIMNVMDEVNDAIFHNPYTGVGTINYLLNKAGSPVDIDEAINYATGMVLGEEMWIEKWLEDGFGIDETTTHYDIDAHYYLETPYIANTITAASDINAVRDQVTVWASIPEKVNKLSVALALLKQGNITNYPPGTIYEDPYKFYDMETVFATYHDREDLEPTHKEYWYNCSCGHSKHHHHTGSCNYSYNYDCLSKYDLHTEGVQNTYITKSISDVEYQYESPSRLNVQIESSWSSSTSVKTKEDHGEWKQEDPPEPPQEKYLLSFAPLKVNLLQQVPVLDDGGNPVFDDNGYPEVTYNVLLEDILYTVSDKDNNGLYQLAITDFDISAYASGSLYLAFVTQTYVNIEVPNEEDDDTENDPKLADFTLSMSPLYDYVPIDDIALKEGSDSEENVFSSFRIGNSIEGEYGVKDIFMEIPNAYKKIKTISIKNLMPREDTEETLISFGTRPQSYIYAKQAIDEYFAHDEFLINYNGERVYTRQIEDTWVKFDKSGTYSQISDGSFSSVSATADTIYAKIENFKLRAGDLIGVSVTYEDVRHTTTQTFYVNGEDIPRAYYTLGIDDTSDYLIYDDENEILSVSSTSENWLVEYQEAGYYAIMQQTSNKVLGCQQEHLGLYEWDWDDDRLFWSYEIVDATTNTIVFKNTDGAYLTSTGCSFSREDAVILRLNQVQDAEPILSNEPTLVLNKGVNELMGTDESGLLELSYDPNDHDNDRQKWNLEYYGCLRYVFHNVADNSYVYLDGTALSMQTENQTLWLAHTDDNPDYFYAKYTFSKENQYLYAQTDPSTTLAVGSYIIGDDHFKFEMTAPTPPPVFTSIATSFYRLSPETMPGKHLSGSPLSIIDGTDGNKTDWLIEFQEVRNGNNLYAIMNRPNRKVLGTDASWQVTVQPWFKGNDYLLWYLVEDNESDGIHLYNAGAGAYYLPGEVELYLNAPERIPWTTTHVTGYSPNINTTITYNLINNLSKSLLTFSLLESPHLQVAAQGNMDEHSTQEWHIGYYGCKQYTLYATVDTQDSYYYRDITDDQLKECVGPVCDNQSLGWWIDNSPYPGYSVIRTPHVGLPKSALYTPEIPNHSEVVLSKTYQWGSLDPGYDFMLHDSNDPIDMYETLADGWYNISTTNNYLLEENGSDIQAKFGDLLPSEGDWLIESVGTNTYTIVNRSSKMALGIDGGNTVVPLAFNPTDTNQQWVVYANQDGSSQLFNVGAQHYLVVSETLEDAIATDDGSEIHDNGAILNVNIHHTGTLEHPLTTGSTLLLSNKGVYKFISKDGANLVIEEHHMHGSNDNHWQANYRGGLQYSLKNMDGNQYLTAGMNFSATENFWWVDEVLGTPIETLYLSTPSTGHYLYVDTADTISMQASLDDSDNGYKFEVYYEDEDNDFVERAADLPYGNTLVNGVQFEYYDLNGLTDFPDFDSHTPDLTGVSFAIFTSGVRAVNLSTQSATRFTGYIKIPDDGIYTFELSSKDGSRLYFGDQLLIDNGGLHNFRSLSEKIALKQGYHEIKVEYFDSASSGGRLRLFAAEDPASPVLATNLYVDIALENAFFTPLLTQGIGYDYYKDYMGGALPNFNDLNITMSGVRDNIVSPLIEQADHYALKYNGYIDIPSDGAYNFYLDSDDGSKLLIDGQLVIDNDGSHASILKSDYIGLRQGTHSIEVEYFQNIGTKNLDVSWRRYDSENISGIPNDRLFQELLPPISAGPTTSGIILRHFSVDFSGQDLPLLLDDYEADFAQLVYNTDIPPGLSGSYVLQYSGYIDVPDNANYRFYCESKDRSRLSIDDKLVVFNNRDEGVSTEASGAIGLSAGQHKIRVEYFNTADAGTPSIRIDWLSSAGMPRKALDRLNRGEANISRANYNVPGLSNVLIEDQGNGFYAIMDLASKKVYDHNENLTDFHEGEVGQQWLIMVTNGSYQIINVLTGKYLQDNNSWAINYSSEAPEIMTGYNTFIPNDLPNKKVISNNLLGNNYLKGSNFSNIGSDSDLWNLEYLGCLQYRMATEATINNSNPRYFAQQNTSNAIWQSSDNNYFSAWWIEETNENQVYHLQNTTSLDYARTFNFGGVEVLDVSSTEQGEFRFIPEDFQVIGEVGISATDDDWKTVNLDRSYSNPIVVLGPVTQNSSDRFTVRVKNVNSSNFKWRVHEWGYENGSHGNETVHYMVVEAGHYAFENGMQLYARDKTNVNENNFTNVTFPSEMTNPLFLTQITTDGTAANARNNGYSVRLQQQENKDQSRSIDNETVDAIFMEQGVVLGYMDFKAGLKTNVDDSWRTLTYGSGISFSNSPKVLADVFTYNENDPISLHYRNKSATSIQFTLEEDKSRNNETDHANEEVGWMAFERSGFLIAQDADLFSGPLKAVKIKSENPGLDEEEGHGVFKVFPNPTDGELTLFVPVETKGNLLIQGIDVYGRVLFEREEVAESGNFTYEIEDLHSYMNNGLFILKVTTGENQYVRRILLE